MIEVYRGADEDITLTYKVDGAAYDLSGAELTFSVVDFNDPDTVLIERQNTAAGGDDTEIEPVTDYSDGQFYLHILGTDTENLVAEANYYYWQVNCTLSGKSFPLDQGILHIKESYPT
jgi:hypothetical protein